MPPIYVLTLSFVSSFPPVRSTSCAEVPIVVTTGRILLLVAMELAVVPPLEDPALMMQTCPTPPRPLTGSGQNDSTSGIVTKW